MHLVKIWQEWNLFSIKFSFEWVYFRAAKPSGCFSIYIWKWHSYLYLPITAAAGFITRLSFYTLHENCPIIILGKRSKKVRNSSANILFIKHNSYTSYIIDMLWIIFLKKAVFFWGTCKNQFWQRISPFFFFLGKNDQKINISFLSGIR